MSLFTRKDKFHYLRRQLGKERVQTAPEILKTYGMDATVNRGLPCAVIFAESADDIQATVDFAREMKLSITPRGRGSGMSGGSVPDDGGLVLTCERMKEIESLDPEARMVVAQPGVVTKTLQDASLKHNLFYPPDPSSYTISSIGGNVAENAGGLHCFKYGVTGHYVLGVEYVDANGEVQKTGIWGSKVHEPDLTPILVGSEGTLGIFTKIGLRLIPAPERTVTLAANFADTPTAFAAIEEIIACGIVPSILEFLDKTALQAASDYAELDFSPEVSASVLMELDGQADDVEESLLKIQQLLSEHALTTESARDSDHRERLWQLRRSISPSLSRIASGKIHEDIAVPRGRLQEMSRRVNIISLARKLNIAVYGHAGDGNLHVVVLFDQKTPSQVSAARETGQDIFKAALALGGTITGEHGVGISKRYILPWQFPEEVLTLTRQVKEIFDPNHIFNPGKILPSPLSKSFR